ncbi:MAG: LysR family transcriptional regulator [Alphaproteobacteria bacterium]|nr:LysR family transcriptional regulator [Alphaproteobacteria bacterium]
MDQLAGMAVFARVVEEKGFTAAARSLNLSKAAVSKQVARLEDRLGVRLLNRSTRRLGLTEAGRDYYERAQRILAEVEDAEQAASSRVVHPRGLLRVNAPVSFGQTYLTPILPAFMLRWPELKVELTLIDRFVDLIDEGFDLAVRVAVPDGSPLIARRLCTARHVVAAAPSYLAARGTPQRPADLARHDCLLYLYLTTGDEWRFLGPDGRAFGVRVAGPLRANNGDALRHAAAAGLGVLYSPDFLIADMLQRGVLLPVLADWRTPELAIQAVYPPGRPLGAKVRVFIDFLVETLAHRIRGATSR